jgi:alpha-tubulin suppressor-like RCC1 family protein
VSGLASGVTAVALGDEHTCALTANGGVKCWGNNDNGQIGDGTTSNRLTPTDVVGLIAGVTWITAGKGFSCAVTTTGHAKCWGTNGFGELGDGTTSGSSTPVDVATSGVLSLTTGDSHSCARHGDSTVTCWGINTSGQLGAGTSSRYVQPVRVSVLPVRAASIAAGGSHTCVLTTTGGVKCWGDNWLNGQMGSGTNVLLSLTPVDVVGLAAGVRAIAAGSNHTCALMEIGTVKCWGNNYNGELGGDTTVIVSRTPVDVVD